MERFWTSVGASATKDLFLHPELVVATASQLAPYQFNPVDLNPLRDLLVQEVDFEAVRTRSPVRLLVSATRVQDGAVRVFRTKAISLAEVVLASACLPRLHHSVSIHGEAHWDGGYAANPPVIPLVGASRTSDVLLVQLIPTDHAGLPVTKSEIDKRLGQITFNAPLQKELEAIGMMKKLVRKEGEPTSRLGRKIDRLRLHRLSAEHYVDGLSQASVLNTDGNFLIDLRDRGRAAADAWLLDEFAPSGRAPFAERHFDSPRWDFHHHAGCFGHLPMALPTVSAAYASRAPSGLGCPAVVSRAVCRSISEFSSAPSSTMTMDNHIQVIKPTPAPNEP